MSIERSILLWSIGESQRVEQAQDGLKAIMRGYYEDYTDAVELDGFVWRAFLVLAEWADVDDWDDWRIEAEREIARDLRRPLKALTEQTRDEIDEEEDQR